MWNIFQGRKLLCLLFVSGCLTPSILIRLSCLFYAFEPAIACGFAIALCIKLHPVHVRVNRLNGFY